MHIDKTFMSGKVSRRIFALFVLSAFIPLLVTTMLTYGQVSSLIYEQNHAKLVDASKDFALDVNQRLIQAQDVLTRTALRISGGGYMPNKQVLESLKYLYSGLAILRADGKPSVLFGDIQAWPKLDKTEMAHLMKRESQLTLRTEPGSTPRIQLLHIVERASPGTFVLIAELKQDYLWGGDENFPYMTGLCIFADSGIMLFCSRPELAAASSILANHLSETAHPVQLMVGEEPSVLGQWELYLKPKFNVPPWTAMAVTPMSVAMSPGDKFTRIFIGVILLTILLVALLSVSQIRRTMGPLERLIVGTRRLAGEDFNHRVDVARNDEFGELANSFNEMSARLGDQLGTLKTLASVDRVILTRQDIDPAFEIVLARIKSLVDAGFLGIVVLDDVAAQEARIYLLDSGQTGSIAMKRISVAPEAVQQLGTHTNGFRPDDGNLLQNYILEPEFQITGNLFMLPILAEGTLSAFVCIELNNTADLPQPVLLQLRDLGDRIGVALSATGRTEQLIYQARHDDLTGLPNRLLFKERLESEISLAQREGKLVILFFIDLDHFKSINDTLGHTAGDLLLKEAAHRLRASSRESDTVARLGGDEFAIILPGVSRIQSATTVAESILRKLSEPFNIQGYECFINASIGIAICPGDGDNGEILLRNADTAMYRAKAMGRGRFVYFKEQMNVAAIEHMTLEREIRQGMLRGEFVVYYQPKMDMASGRLSGVEALLRWNHPTRGLVSPSVFIGVAEDIGVIEEMGRQVIQEACAQYSVWDNAGISVPHIAVNVSIRQFRSGDLTHNIKEAMRSASMPPSALQVEVTESLFMDKKGDGISILENLRALGIGVAIDDFGTGYSSLSQVRSLPADTLKIDRSFIEDMIRDKTARVIAQMLLDLAHALNKTVVAEGVEYQDQFNLLREWGCDAIQGYYYSKPLTPEEFAEFVRAKEAISIV